MTATITGRTVSVGSPASAGTSGVPAIAALVEREEACGHTAVVVGLDGRPMGVVGLADRIRPEAGRARQNGRADSCSAYGRSPRPAASAAHDLSRTTPRRAVTD